MSQLPHTSPFDAIRHEDEQGKEFWSARELGKLLGYGEYRKFKNAIEKAEEACQNSGQAVADHFAHVGGMIEVGKGARRKVEDVRLTRYACYLLVENADPSKPIVALGQTLFFYFCVAFPLPPAVFRMSPYGTFHAKTQPDWEKRFSPLRFHDAR